MANQTTLRALLSRLVGLDKETEWVEFKHNKDEPREIGENISALANAALLCGQNTAYICWGIDDKSHHVIGTSFRPTLATEKGQELENWLSISLSPRIDIRFHEFTHSNGHPVAMIEIPAACGSPVQFQGTAYIRVGSYTKRIKEHPEKEKSLWKKLSQSRFEDSLALTAASSDEVLRLIDYPAYFQHTRKSLPDNRAGIIGRLIDEKFLIHVGGDLYDISNLCAILFARELGEFGGLKRKALRVIRYQGDSRSSSPREQLGAKGYAIGFLGAVRFIQEMAPSHEQFKEVLRKDVPLYPPDAIREFLANALIHQDFAMTGTGPMVEVFDNRMEISNPGKPLIDTLRFVDHPPISRNEDLAYFMRRIGVCEERGTGVDKALTAIEFHMLPPPDFSATESHTVVTMYAPRPLAEMDSSERIRACYQHACLQHVCNKKLSNESLRKRLGIKDHPIASKIIRDTVDAGLIKLYGSAGRRYAKYVPAWS